MVYPGTYVSRDASLVSDSDASLSFHHVKPLGEPEGPSLIWLAPEKLNELWPPLDLQALEAPAPPPINSVVASSQIYGQSRSEARPDSSTHLSIPPPIPPYYQPNAVSGNGPGHLPWDSGPPFIRDTPSVNPMPSFSSEFHIFGHPTQLFEEISVSLQLSSLRSSNPSSCTPESLYSNNPDPFLSSEKALHSARKRRKSCYPKLLPKEEVPQLALPWYHNRKPGNRMPRDIVNLFFKIDAKGKSCIFCDDFTNRQEHLREEHVSAHINHKPYRCIKCGESFSRKSNHSPTKHKPKWQETFSSTPTINTPYPNYADTDPTTHLYHDSIP
ncbi:hypothetical protein M408DRAFT_269995 [Serendipita vermifera MAFF 305830]|uniref:C2H2-type domain-containing protein n=1 Tax=Serendipita vermifera MAFF 305830 TaxID=933852 RepID=A0A0C2WXC0_SERVB|nr:hypothetical protein M408DRAFT_269995 [Serendipita vermifera MAFF 305830]